MTTRAWRELVRRTAAEVAAGQAGTASRRQLRAVGITRWQIRAQLDAGRWHARGRQTLLITDVGDPEAVRWWTALHETGAGAVLAGVTALLAAGLQQLTEASIHVACRPGTHPVKVRGVRVHETRRYDESVVVRDGIPREQPATAAVHAALWAPTDRQAALWLVVVVQQRLASVDEVDDALALVRRDRRRRLLLAVAADLRLGVRSLGEMDLARGLRRRGLPEPDRQAMRRLPGGSVFLDVDFDAYALTLEVDGSQHERPEARLPDVLRDIDVTSGGRSVVRVSLVAWRAGEDAVLDALERLFRSRGWTPGAPVAGRPKSRAQ